jgi:hypothetical protein
MIPRLGAWTLTALLIIAGYIMLADFRSSLRRAAQIALHTGNRRD